MYKDKEDEKKRILDRACQISQQFVILLEANAHLMVKSGRTEEDIIRMLDDNKVDDAEFRAKLLADVRKHGGGQALPLSAYANYHRLELVRRRREIFMEYDELQRDRALVHHLKAMGTYMHATWDYEALRLIQDQEKRNNQLNPRRRVTRGDVRRKIIDRFELDIDDERAFLEMLDRKGIIDPDERERHLQTFRMIKEDFREKKQRRPDEQQTY
jgi:hypothetical protein